MNDLERIEYIEKKLGIKLNKVSLENLFTERYFLTAFGYGLSQIQAASFPFKGVRNYSLDEAGNVTGLALDFCPLFLLEDNYLGNFKHLKKLKLKNARLSNYSFLFQLESLKELDLSKNEVSNASFLEELTSLTALDLSFNNLSNAEFLKKFTSLTTLNLGYNNLSNTDFLKEFTTLTSLDLRNNNLSNPDFVSELIALTSLDLRNNRLSNADFLRELPALTSLDLSYNKLSNYEFLGKLAGLTKLGLSSNNLSSADFLKGLKSLTSLDLSFNNLNQEGFLKGLKNLTALDLSFNNLWNYDFLKELPALISLDLRNNELSNADFLKELPALISLDLRNNELSNADFLKKLPALTALDLSYNSLSNYDFLDELKNLTSLYLRNSDLSNADFLKELKNLTSLDLSSNYLSNAEFLNELTNLTSLDLSYNNLSNADSIKELKNLTSLYLRNNNLSNYDFLNELKSLTSLYLRNNSLSNADFLKELVALTALDLRYNENLQISAKILENTSNPLRIIAANFEIEDSIYESYKETPEKIWELISAKLKKPHENKALLECRVVLIGQGNAGKTSLRQRLLDLPFEDRGKTEGVEIDGKSFKIRDEDVWINIWDFGGQEVYHATHKFFFRDRCLYILVVDVRAGMERYIVRYWLRQIKELAKSNAPLIIVANKAEDTSQTDKIDENYKQNFESLRGEFEEIYPNIRAVHYVSTNTPLKTEDVKTDMLKAIDENLPEVFTTYPPYYAQTRELFKTSHDGKSKFGNFISKEDFEKQLNEEAQKDSKVVEILDILGVFCHFKQNENEPDDELEKMYVLNPEWITKGVYKILSSYILAEKKGRVELSDIEAILNKSEYQGKNNYIIKLMQRFKLCFKTIERQRKYVIFPTWLPIEEKGYDYFSTNVTSFGYKYTSDSEMEKAITTFIVENHKGNEENKFWRRGILLHKKDSSKQTVCRILVKADIKTEIITITIEGEKTVRESYLNEIKEHFRNYHLENSTQVIEGKIFEIEKIEDLIAESTLPDKQLLEELPKLQNKLERLNSKIETIKPLKSGYETLEKIAELEKINSMVEAIKTERVKTYEGLVIALLIFFAIAYVILYLQTNIFNWFKQMFGDWEHFFTLGIPPIFIVTALVWRYFSKDNALWGKVITAIENKVSKNLQKKNKKELEQYNTAQEDLDKLRTQIEKAKSELED